MGDIADMIVEGEACQICACIFDDIMEGAEAPGYPRTCDTCGGESLPSAGS